MTDPTQNKSASSLTAVNHRQTRQNYASANSNNFSCYVCKSLSECQNINYTQNKVDCPSQLCYTHWIHTEQSDGNFKNDIVERTCYRGSYDPNLTPFDQDICNKPNIGKSLCHKICNMPECNDYRNDPDYNASSAITTSIASIFNNPVLVGFLSLSFITCFIFCLYICCTKCLTRCKHDEYDTEDDEEIENFQNTLNQNRNLSNNQNQYANNATLQHHHHDSLNGDNFQRQYLYNQPQNGGYHTQTMSTNNTPTKNVTFQQQNSRHNLIYDEDADTTIKLQDPEIDERDLPEVINNTVNLIDKTGEDKRISLTTDNENNPTSTSYYTIQNHPVDSVRHNSYPSNLTQQTNPPKPENNHFSDPALKYTQGRTSSDSPNTRILKEIEDDIVIDHLEKGR